MIRDQRIGRIILVSGGDRGYNKKVYGALEAAKQASVAGSKKYFKKYLKSCKKPAAVVVFHYVGSYADP